MSKSTALTASAMKKGQALIYTAQPDGKLKLSTAKITRVQTAASSTQATPPKPRRRKAS